jgi:hypothetical protein
LKDIVYTEHAKNKFVILANHGFAVSRDAIELALKNPDKVEPGYGGRVIAQRVLDEGHVIRVIYEELPEMIKVITFYPGRMERYENKLR